MVLAPAAEEAGVAPVSIEREVSGERVVGSLVRRGGV